MLTVVFWCIVTQNARSEPGQDQDATTQTASAQLAPDRTLSLPSDTRHTLWIPSDYQHQGKTIDVLVDFHSSPSLVRASTRRAKLNCVVISVKYSGLSSVYRVPFSKNRQLFAAILDEALEALRAETDFPKDAQWGQLAITSFSAGFGAVREILKTQDDFERINGIFMVDSLYCGYVGDGTDAIEKGVVSPHLMKDFLRFAKLAADGEKVMIITHSMVPTPGYASTCETADYLMDQLDLEPEPVAIVIEPAIKSEIQAVKIRLYRKAIRKGFSLYGSSGSGGADHVAHMRNMDYWLPALPIAKHEAHAKVP